MSSIFPVHTGISFTKTTHGSPTAELIPSAQTLPSPFVAVVTGASRGIGAETAKALAEAGASGLIVTARTQAALEETVRSCEQVARDPKLKIWAIAADSGLESAAQDIARLVQTEHHGRLDCLINNAGLVSTDESAFQPKFEEIRVDQFEIPMQVNYIGRFALIKYLLPSLLSSPDGLKTVVNLSSLASHFVGFAASGYNISALATNRLTEDLAMRYNDKGLVAFAVHPGVVNSTPPPGMPQHILEHATDDPGLCGAFIIWLIKEKREWLSGRYLSASWDVNELQAMKEEIVEGDKLKFRMQV